MILLFSQLSLLSLDGFVFRCYVQLELEFGYLVIVCCCCPSLFNWINITKLQMTSVVL
ncbi:hypothetical protein RchiOBHm_Chr5g0062411 [Rosa chinensis]|uniref:Uncharacterized protein n=1 Tax=Rosa chinensis TaxID=74649 RepID=A0A2P6QI65_ROSCH|nr:hypothetical protein RchiOBHm_Chr5g0062411 [Rosa chinensis]